MLPLKKKNVLMIRYINFLNFCPATSAHLNGPATLSVLNRSKRCHMRLFQILSLNVYVSKDSVIVRKLLVA